MDSISAISALRLLIQLLDGGASLFWAILPGVLIGAALGLAAGIGVYKSFRRAGAWELNWKHAIWVQRFVLLLLPAGLCISGLLIGGAQSATRFASASMRSGALRENGLRHAGNACATLVMSLDCSVQSYLATGTLPSRSDPKSLEQMELFEAGKTELHVGEFLARLKLARDVSVQDIVSSASAGISSKTGIQPGSAIAKIGESFLSLLAGVIWNNVVNSKVDPEIGAAITKCFDTLPQGAAVSGDFKTISHRELSDHIVENGIVAIVELPIRRFVRSYQIMIVLVAAVSLAAVVLGFKLARKHLAKQTEVQPAETVPAETL